MRRQQAPSSAGHLLEVASASSVGTPSSRQVGRAPDSGAIPRSVFFDFALGSGAAPGPRWGHTATAVGDRLWIYGGMGTRVFSDLYVYSPGEGILPAAVAKSSANAQLCFHCCFQLATSLTLCANSCSTVPASCVV